MNNFKKTTVFFMLFSITLFSCSKENTSTNAKYVDKDYYPGTQELAKQEVLEFLQTTKTYGQAMAKTTTTYQDRELSEAKWVMEGASNYLTNVNMQNIDGEVSVQNYEYEFDLLNVNSDIYIKGEDMTTKFDNLFIDVETYKLLNNTKAYVVDFEIKLVSESKATLSSTVLFSEVNGSVSGPPGSDKCSGIYELNDYVQNHYLGVTSVGAPFPPSYWSSNVIIAATPQSKITFSNIPINDNVYPYYNPTYNVLNRYQYFYIGLDGLSVYLSIWKERAIKFVNNYIHHKQGTTEYAIPVVFEVPESEDFLPYMLPGIRFRCGPSNAFPYDDGSGAVAVYVDAFSYGLRNAY